MSTQHAPRGTASTLHAIISSDFHHVIECHGQMIRASIVEKLKESLPKIPLFLIRFQSWTQQVPFHLCAVVNRSVFHCAGDRLRRVGCLRAAVGIAQCGLASITTRSLPLLPLVSLDVRLHHVDTHEIQVPCRLPTTAPPEWIRLRHSDGVPRRRNTDGLHDMQADCRRHGQILLRSDRGSRRSASVHTRTLCRRTWRRLPCGGMKVQVQ
jgi:hypothetical protein